MPLECKCDRQAYFEPGEGLLCTEFLPTIKRCDLKGRERSCPYYKRMGSSLYLLPEEEEDAISTTN